VSWALVLTAPAGELELLAARLFERGALGVELQEPEQQLMPGTPPNSLSRASSNVLRLSFTASRPSSTCSHRLSLKYSAATNWLSMLEQPSIFHGIRRVVMDSGAMKKPRRIPGPRILENEPM